MSGGASLRPSVRERCERASWAAVSAEALRRVGTGASLRGKEGVTVRWGVVDGAGFAAVVVVVAGLAAADVLVDGLAAVVEVVAAAFGGVGDHAARSEDEEKPRGGMRYANWGDREVDDVNRAEKPLRACDVAIVRMYTCLVSHAIEGDSRTSLARSHALLRSELT
jgi:hypothetical protein